MGVGEGTDDDNNGEEEDDDFRRVRRKGEEACEAQGEGNVGVDFQLLPRLFAVSAVPAACHRSHAIKTRQPAALSQAALFHHFNVLRGINSSSHPDLRWRSRSKDTRDFLQHS